MIFLLLMITVVQGQIEIGQLVTDFIKSDISTPPGGVHFSVCKTEDSFALMNHLSNNAIFSSELLEMNLETIMMANGKMFPLLFIIDLGCVKSISILDKANEKGYYGPPHKWLLIDGVGTYSAAELDLIDEESNRRFKRQDNLLLSQNKLIISGSAIISHKSEHNWNLQRKFNLYLKDSNTYLRNYSYFNKRHDENILTEKEIKDNIRKFEIKSQGAMHNSNNRTKRGYNQLTVHYKHLNSGNKIIIPFEESFEEMDIFIDSQIFILTMHNNSVHVIEIYRRGKMAKLTSEVVAHWSKTKGFTWKTNVTISVKRINLHKTKIKAAMVVTDPNTMKHLTDLYNKHIDTITKVNYGLFMHAIEALNATVDFFVVDSWGYSKNGSWNGMVGYLQRQEADVGATALFFTSDRTTVLDYIAMTTPTRAAFFFRQPPLSLVSNLFTLPFSHTVWLASAGLVLLSCGFLFMTNRWEKKTSVTVYGTAAILNNSWSDVALLAVGAICQQGSTVVSHGIPGRIVTFLLFVTVMFLYTSYSANIVALLQSSTSSIQTLEDLLKSPLKVGVHDIVYNKHYFQVANDPIRRALYQEKVSPPGKPSQFMTLEEGVQRVQKGLFAFHSELNSGWQIVQQTFQEEEKCGLQTIPFLQVIDPYLAVQKNSPYKETFKIIYRRLWECGLQGRHVKRLYTRKPLCNGGQRSSFVSVGIADCYPAMLVLLYGVLFSIIIAVVECITHHWK